MGAHPPDAAFADEPEKREAEGRAPTGVFALTGGFASNPEDLTETDLPVVRADQDFVCVDDLGLANVDRAGLTQVAQKACASGECIHNEADVIRPENVLHALIAADALGRARKA
ncbi:hypothetical protein SAMN06295888_11045 [Desulfonatronum zhilinae]|nr:hypothetical protein SAMN06295888_11045 [Desulfonatronum zhilinae]